MHQRVLLWWTVKTFFGLLFLRSHFFNFSSLSWKGNLSTMLQSDTLSSILWQQTGTFGHFAFHHISISFRSSGRLWFAGFFQFFVFLIARIFMIQFWWFFLSAKLFVLPATGDIVSMKHLCRIFSSLCMPQ